MTAFSVATAIAASTKAASRPMSRSSAAAWNSAGHMARVDQSTPNPSRAIGSTPSRLAGRGSS
jgi:hypothetical protein